MSEGQGPQSQVGSSVRDCSQDKFNSLDHLVNKQVSESVVLSTLFQANEQGFSDTEVFLVILHDASVGLLEGIVIFELINILIDFILVRVGNDTRFDEEHDWDTADSDDHHQLHDEGLESLSAH